MVVLVLLEKHENYQENIALREVLLVEKNLQFQKNGRKM